MSTDQSSRDLDPSEPEEPIGRLLGDMGRYGSNTRWDITGEDLRARRSHRGWANAHTLSTVAVGAVALAAAVTLVAAVATSGFHSQPTHLPSLSATASTASHSTGPQRSTTATTSPMTAPTTTNPAVGPTVSTLPAIVPATTTPTTQSPPAVATNPPATSSCQSSNLTAQGGRQGEAGSAQGTVVLTNVGQTACVLSGIPSVGIIGPGGSPLGVTMSAATNQAEAPLAVSPGSSGTLIVNWSNWCGAAPGSLQISIGLVGGGTVTGPFDGPPGYTYVPPCISAGQVSSLSVVNAYLAGS
jgi:hypothetical protein